jgi:NADPH:quinone reductase-like Zn-dependent oxidoreductase
MRAKPCERILGFRCRNERIDVTGSRVCSAYVLESLGYDGLVQRRRKVALPGRGQVLVRMRAASLNYRDLKILKGIYAAPPKLPIVPLSDGAAEIVEVGSGVDRFKAGDRVLPIYWEGWHSGPLTPERKGWKQKSGDVDGVAIEYATYDEADVLPIPASLSYEEAACLPCAGVTAWHGLVYMGHVKAGDSVLVMGSGGVSVAGLQIAKMSGARVIALSGDDEKLQRLMNMGATDGLNYKRTPDWGQVVAKLTDGRGVDHVLEVGGAGTIGQSVRAAKDGGHIASIGDLTGQFASGAIERNIRLTPIAVGSREMTEDLMRAIDLHREMPVIDSYFPFSRLKDALAYLESGRHFGKIVIRF